MPPIARVKEETNTRKPSKRRGDALASERAAPHLPSVWLHCCPPSQQHGGTALTAAYTQCVLGASPRSPHNTDAQPPSSCKPPQSTDSTTSPQPFQLFSSKVLIFSHKLNSPRFIRHPLKPFSRLHSIKVGLSSDFLALIYITVFAFAGNFGPPATSTVAFPHKSSLLNVKTSRFYPVSPCKRPKAA